MFTPLEQAVLDEIIENTLGFCMEGERYWVEHDAICSSGSVTGLIYYHQTTTFFDTHEEEILNLAGDCEFDISVVEHGMQGFKNQMAWFAFEALKDQVYYNYLENKDD